MKPKLEITMNTKPHNSLNVISTLSNDQEKDEHFLAAARPSPTSIAEGPDLARALMTKEFMDSYADSNRFEKLAQSDPGFIGRLFATAEQKAAWEKQRLRMEMVGKARLTRLRMISETELRILATISEAIVKATEVGIARRFYDFAQAEINLMAVNTEKHRKTFMVHMEERERTLVTLGSRLRAPYERSIEGELHAHFEWFDTATTELLEKLKQKVVTYAGSIDG
jgi:hypothetical protein